MAKIIQFPKEKLQDQQVQQLLEVSNEIDDIIVRCVTEQGLKPRDVAGILAHRLGALMRHVEEKDKLWDVCEKVLKRQAAIE